MAAGDADITSKVYKQMNVVGNQREDTITFTSSTTGDVTVVTRLEQDEQASLLSTDGGAAGNIYVNSDRTSDNYVGMEGQIFADNITNSKAYTLVARGW